jgi:hypothetical protein
MRDMREKFGAEVKTFPYAFVIDKHYPGWDSPVPGGPVEPPVTDRAPSLPALIAGKFPKYIEVKSRA